ncbi:MAG: cation-translocating P-type ATPase [Candidatus Woesearchaeota archaeon]|jgi:Ca2+-transporting ATPase|nr:cation-translocating P-type ATPase [Candidatus Woesearchaeota archaeon]
MEYYKEETSTILKELDSTSSGLSNQEVKRRIKAYGHNLLKTKTNIDPIKILISQFQGFINYLLIFASIFSLAFGHYLDAAIIIVIILANAAIGFFQELSAQKSLEALKKLNLVVAKVYRDSKLIKTDSKNLVVGDVIFLEAGDRIPADCRIIEERKLRVEESALTGESLPVNKHQFVINDNCGIGDQKNMLFSSTTVTEGSAKAIVVSTAMKTEIGRITKLITQVEDEQTPLQKRLDEFGKKLGYAIIGICVFVFIALTITKGFSKDNILSFALVAISLAVAAVPTALSAVVTVALSIGVKNLLSKKALVRKLSSVETLGSCNVICTDKTGTLTQNEMTVRNAWTLDNETSIEGVGYNPQGHIEKRLNPMLYKIGLGCNNSSHYKEKGLWKISGDPTEAALRVSAIKAGIKEDLANLDEIPFDSTRKMMSTLIQEKKEIFVFSKGSTHAVLNKCSHVVNDGKVVKLTEDIKKIILVQNDLYSAQALRVLSFAYKEIKHKKDFTEEKLIFVGLQAMIDPPRPDVIEAIAKTKDAGIRVIMITGDYKETARAIGEQVGILGEVMTGEELEVISDKELGEVLKRNTNIFARVNPEHKQRIVTELQRQGNVVAMTGDGVNDAPALKKANIGIAVGSGTDVAKEAADFVLLDDSFTNIVNAIEEGRGIYDNIQKSIMLLLSGNFGEVLIIFLAVIFGFNLPLTAILLLWINMVTDGAPALAFGVDPYSKNIMKRKPISSKEGILPRSKLILIGVLGSVGTIIGLYLFSIYGGNVGDKTSALSQTMIFNFIAVYELVLVFVIREQYRIKQLSNLWLWGAIVLTLGLQALIMYTPLSTMFGVVALSLVDILVLFYAGAFFYICYLIYYFFNISFNKDND